MFVKIVFVVVSLFGVQVAVGSTWNESQDSLEAMMVAVNASLIEHCTTIQGAVKTALKHRHVLEVSDKVFSNIQDQKKILGGFLEEVKQTEDNLLRFREKQSKCGQKEKALSVCKQLSLALDRCSKSVDDFLDEYLDEVIRFSNKYYSAAQQAYLKVAQCIPDGGVDVDKSKHCLNVESLHFYQTFTKLEQEWVVIQESAVRTSEVLFEEVNLCTHRKTRLAEDIINRLIDRTIRCVHEDLTDKELTMEDFQEEVDKTKAVLTELYEEIQQEVESASEDDMISNSLTEISGIISGAEETVARMSSGTFDMIADVEANGSYPQCVEGAKEKAQGIEDEALEILPGCESALQELDVEYVGELGDILRELDEEKLAAEESVTACEPEDETEIAQAIACVGTARDGASEVFLSLHQRFLSDVNDTEANLGRANEEARRCVDTATHVAGDRTGYLRYEIQQCMSNIDASTTPAVTLTKTGESLQERLSHLKDETSSAFNNKIIVSLVLRAEDKVFKADNAFVDLGDRIMMKIDEVDDGNFSACTVGLAEEVVSALKYSMIVTRDCLDPLTKLAETYHKQLSSFSEDCASTEEDINNKLADCLPASTLYSNTAQCLEAETADGIQTVSVLEQTLATLVQRSNHQAVLVSSEVEVCITDEQAETISSQEQLILQLDNCVQMLAGLEALSQD